MRAQRGTVLRVKHRRGNDRRAAAIDFAPFFRRCADLLCVVGFDGRFHRVNPAFRSVLGYTEADLLATSLVDLVHSEDRSSTVANLDKLRAGLPSLSFENRCRCKDGSLRWLAWIASPVASEGLFYAVARNVTESKRTEEQIRLVVESAPNAMLMVDRAGRIVLVNAQVEKLFGYSRQELLGRPVEILVPERYRHQHRAWRDLFGAEPKPRMLGSGRDLCGVRKDGREVPMEIGLTPIRTEQGEFVLSAMIDITERKRAEETRQLRQLASHLQSAREEQRTHIARELHDELGQALTALKLDIAWLSKKLPAEPTNLHERTRAMEGLVDDTLAALRRISAELRPAVLDDFGLLEAVRWQARDFENRTGIACALDLPAAEIEWEAGRSTAAFRILQESLTNVLRHARATRIKVRIARRNGHVLVEVRDNGRGITHEQAAGARSLGLLGMRERARLFGGELDVRGVRGGGTTVTLRLPLGPEPKGAP